jgi:hypothetical protein
VGQVAEAGEPWGSNPDALRTDTMNLLEGLGQVVGGSTSSQNDGRDTCPSRYGGHVVRSGESLRCRGQCYLAGRS